MKRIITVLFAVMMVLSMTVTCFADFETPVKLGLFAGDTNNGWGAVNTVNVNKPGEYTLTYDGEQRTLEWLIIKTATGNQENEPTSIPAGTIISITGLVIDGVSYTFDGGKVSYDYRVGPDTTIEIIPWLNPNFGGADHIDNNPKLASKIEVTFIVNEYVEEVVEEPAEEPVEEPAEEPEVEPEVEEPEEETPVPETPAVEDTPVADNTVAEAKSPVLGIILGVAAIAVIAVAAVLIIKKK